VKVFLQENGMGAFRPVPGPADLRGKTGRLRLEGDPDDRDPARWGVAFTAFLLAGGTVGGKK
jgi:hypothetical protein